jgi:hypothetical protein
LAENDLADTTATIDCDEFRIRGNQVGSDGAVFSFGVVKIQRV